MESYVRLDSSDNVVTLTADVSADTAIAGVVTVEKIPRGHKLALQPIPAGEPVRKYAQVIGYAKSDIAAGQHVHTHNLEFRAVDAQYEFATDLRHPPVASEAASFYGYKRADGRVGTRNYLAIVTTVNCSATAARLIADAFGPEELAQYGNVDGVVAYVHGTGCGMADSGDGYDALQRVMWGYLQHPNHAACLLIGLGCEMNQIGPLLKNPELELSNRLQVMTIQGEGGLRQAVASGIEKIREMLPLANAIQREPCPASALQVALQCGGSDAWSGITANPALGYAVDLLVAQGGSGVLAETPEIYGAEHLLTRRSVDEQTGRKLLALIDWWEDYTERNHGTMDNNPSPGNKQGGLTTILEKSLGAAAKGGTSPLAGVYKYAERVDRPGFSFMDSPGYDPVSVTGQIASGCNLVVFTTGRGSVFGCKPAPSIKVATNTVMFQKMEEDMDVDAGEILSAGVSLEQKGTEIFELLLRIASGEGSKSEAQGLGDLEFVPWQIGATM